ncbi:TspO/MBR family protein [Streptomyces sp. NPDC006514]|uniref:TspO/MBR family protein n=1 Tax=Streptomyces sp. NPDC006514 TaxID=3154308 RepID=UPI00339FBA22
MTYGVAAAGALAPADAGAPLFFGVHRYGFALADIVLLLAAIGVTATLFRPLHRTAVALLLPYLLWVWPTRRRPMRPSGTSTRRPGGARGGTRTQERQNA